MTSSKLDFKLPAFAATAPKVYLNPLSDRVEMFKDLKGKSGVYCWINKINGKFYIGSAVDLNNRINDYFQKYYQIAKSSLPIIRAIWKYGFKNFALVILEFKDKDALLSREDYYFQTLNPEYNILKIAGNSLGYKHSPESIKKISDS